MFSKSVNSAFDASLANGHIQIFNFLILAKDMLQNGGDREDVAKIKVEEVEKDRKLSRDDNLEDKNPMDEIEYMRWLSSCYV